MKLIWHIAKKDLQRLRWPLLLLGAIVGAQYAAWWMVRATNAKYPETVTVLWALHLLVAWLLVPQFVHEDPLLGTAEWRVRPISGARLLAAKGLGIFLGLCVWPSLLTLPWWLESGSGPGEIVHAVAVNTLGMIFYTGVAALVAVLTENFARFVAWWLVLAVGTALVGLLMAADLPADGNGAVSAGVVLTRAALGCGLVLVTAAVVVPLAFLTRRAGRVRVMGVAGVVLAAGVALVWPWSLARMLAGTGLARFALPTLSARVEQTALVMPTDRESRPATLRVTAEFTAKSLAAGDQVVWRGLASEWALGAERLEEVPVPLNDSRWWELKLADWARGSEARRDAVTDDAWTRRFQGKRAPLLRNGEALLSGRAEGILWRAELGPSVPVVAGAGAVRGLGQIRVVAVEEATQGEGYPVDRAVRWREIGPLFWPAVLLELVNPDGLARRRWAVTLLTGGGKEFADFATQPTHNLKRLSVGIGRVPVGVLGVTERSSAFNGRWWREAGTNLNEVPLKGAELTSVVLAEADTVEVMLPQTQVVPELVVEGGLEEALRRAQAEDKPVLLRLPGTQGEELEKLLHRWSGREVRELLAKRFVVGQATAAEAVRWRKASDDTATATLVVMDPRGEVRDRLRDLGGEELADALKANLAGKPYAATLTEALAAKGGDDRKLRFRLHEALRARGELTGAFNAILWLMENPRDEYYDSETVEVALRLERLVATDGAVKALLIERRASAAEALGRDPADEGAARMLWVITQGLRHDDALWREFPRLLPRVNPRWWEYTGGWLAQTVRQKRHREAVAAVDLEAFFAAGPEWVRSQLARRAASAQGRPGTVRDWQRRLVWAGRNAVEALAGAGQDEAALRVARAVRRIDRTRAVREALGQALRTAGAVAAADRWRAEVAYEP